MAKVLATVELQDVHDVDEAATLLGLGVATVWRWIKSGKISAVRISGRTLVPVSEIERLKKERATE